MDKEISRLNLSPLVFPKPPLYSAFAIPTFALSLNLPSPDIYALCPGLI